MRWYDIVNTLELLQMYMPIEIKTIQLSQSTCFDLFLEDSKGRFCTKMSSFILAVKQGSLFGMLEKKKKTIIYCLLGKDYIAKNEHTAFYETFFC